MSHQKELKMKRITKVIVLVLMTLFVKNGFVYAEELNLDSALELLSATSNMPISFKGKYPHLDADISDAKEFITFFVEQNDWEAGLTETQLSRMQMILKGKVQCATQHDSVPMCDKCISRYSWQYCWVSSTSCQASANSDWCN